MWVCEKHQYPFLISHILKELLYHGEGERESEHVSEFSRLPAFVYGLYGPYLLTTMKRLLTFGAVRVEA